VLAERTIPSGIASLIIALVPLWMALVDRVLLGRRPGWATGAGLVLGFVGAALLIDGASGRSVPLSGLLVAVAASVCWTAGSLYSRSARLTARPLVGAGMEMMIGGAGLVALGIVRGELALVHPEAFSGRSVLALAYLVTIGSWVGFTCYVWLLRHARTSLVSTYAYVNPVVAVFLGWLILGESITVRTLAAGVVIVASGTGRATGREDSASAAHEPRDRVEGELVLEGVGDAEQQLLAEDGSGELKADG